MIIGTKPQIEVSDRSSLALLAPAVRILGGYQAGFDLVAGDDQAAVERFLVLYVRGTPRLLLPPQLPIMKTAVSSFLGSRRFSGILPTFVQFASWVGGPLSSVSTEISLVSEDGSVSPLKTLMASVLNRDDFQLALRLSYGRPNAKTVAMAISNTGDPLGFAKFGSESMTDDLVAHESEVLERFEGVDLPVVMPERLFAGEWASGHSVLITAPLPLESLDIDPGKANRAADEFSMQNFVARTNLQSSDYWQGIVSGVGNHVKAQPDGDFLSSTVEIIGNVWGSCELDFGASHGDWSRANLGMVRGRVAAFDWERYTALAPRGIDVAHFALFENAVKRNGSALDIERALAGVRAYLQEAQLPAARAEPLIVLALLQMVLRFRTAGEAGLRSSDKKFGPALQAALQTWAS